MIRARAAVRLSRLARHQSRDLALYKDVSAVIDKAIGKIKEHKNHAARSPAYDRSDADQYEFTMHAEGDPEREIHLTLIPMASHVRQVHVVCPPPPWPRQA